MLILTRKSGQTIVIGGGVQVKVLEIRGKQVRIGIDAAPEVAVYRGELFESMQEENRRAATSPKTGLAGLVEGIKPRGRKDG